MDWIGITTKDELQITIESDRDVEDGIEFYTIYLRAYKLGFTVDSVKDHDHDGCVEIVMSCPLDKKQSWQGREFHSAPPAGGQEETDGASQGSPAPVVAGRSVRPGSAGAPEPIDLDGSG